MNSERKLSSSVQDTGSATSQTRETKTEKDSF